MVVTVLLLPGAPALAEEEMARCMLHNEMAAEIGHRFEEFKISGGLSIDGALVELFMSKDGTFTILKRTPNGLSCIVDFGVGWRSVTSPEAEATGIQGGSAGSADSY